MAKKRTTRKELLKGPDEFFTLTGKVIQWSRENAKALMTGICIFLGVVILSSGYRMYSSAQRQSASALFSNTLSSYKQAVQDKENATEVLDTVSADFARLIDQYGGQAEGQLGRIVYGHIELSGKSTDKAIASYQKAFGEYDNDPTLRNVVLNGLATAHMEKGDESAAIDDFEKIASGSSKILVDSALFNLGSLYTKTGDVEKGKQYFERLTKEFPNSLFADIAREKAAG